MIDIIWICMLAGGIILAAYTGNGAAVTDAILSASADAISLVIGLAGIIAFWSGLMQVAEKAGVVDLLARILRPLTRYLFTSVPPDHAAMGTIVLSISANILGLGNAATPLGIKAMEKLNELNPEPGTATDAMCTFLALTTSALTLVPATVVAMRAAAGSTDPARIVAPTIIATSCSTIAAILADRFWHRISRHHH